MFRGERCIQILLITLKEKRLHWFVDIIRIAETGILWRAQKWKFELKRAVLWQEEYKQMGRKWRGKFARKQKAYVHSYVYDGQVLKIKIIITVIIVIQSYFFPFFLVWPILLIHCTYRGSLLHLITLKDTLTHSQSVEILWTRDWPIAEASTWQHVTFIMQTYLAPAGLEPAIPAREWPQTHSLNRTVTGNGNNV